MVGVSAAVIAVAATLPVLSETADAGAPMPPTAGDYVTCSTANGGTAFTPQFEFPQPIGKAGPVTTVTQYFGEIGGCTAHLAGGAVDNGVVFTGLNGDTSIEGTVTGSSKTPWNSVEAGMSGNASSIKLKVKWYGHVGANPLSDTTVTASGVQAYQSIANSNFGWFFGSTNNAGTYSSDVPSGPAGFQSLEATNLFPIASRNVSWTPGVPALAVGGTTTVNVSTLPNGSNAPTNILCATPAALGTWSYQQMPSGGGGGYYQFSGAFFTGLLGTARGNVVTDPVNLPNNYITGVSTDPGSSGCPGNDGSITLNLATAQNANLNLVVGLPLSVNAQPAAMGNWTAAMTSTTCLNPPVNDQLLLTHQVHDMTGSDAVTVCALKDTGAYLIPGGVGREAIWVDGLLPANGIGGLQAPLTYGFLLADCTPANQGAGTGSCLKASATGSFAQTATSGIVRGDLITNFTDPYEVGKAARGQVNGYDALDHPDPNGISFAAIDGTDGFTL